MSKTVTPTLTLALAGDVMLGRVVNRMIGDFGFSYPWGELLSVIRDTDHFLINLECALTARSERWRSGGYKPFYFRANPLVIQTLQLAGVTFAGLANNHAADFGMPGLLDSVRLLSEGGIAHAGAGANLTAARLPAFLTAGERRIGILAFADYPEEWAAGPTSPGINYTPISLAADDFAAIVRAVADVRRQADLVIFSIHWGPNMRPRPPAAFRTFARRVIDAGVDVFWGHSAHVVQGVEIWHGKPILYDTGDFVDDYVVDPELRNDLSGLFLLRVQPPVITRIDVLPVAIGRCQVNRARGADRDWFAERFTSLCAELGTDVVVSDETLTVSVDALPEQGEEERS